MNETKRGPKPVDPQAVLAWRTQRNFLSRGALSQLAKHLGVTVPAVSKWPYVPRDQLDEVANFLGVEPSDLRPDIRQPDPWLALTKKGDL